MLNLLKVPKTHLTDFYDKARFALTWRIGVLFSAVISLLTILTYIEDDRFFPYYLAVLSVIVLALVFMYIKRTYKTVSLLVTVATVAILVFSVVFINDALHIIEPLWMIVIVLFSFFTLGNKWGTFFLVVNTTLYFIYFNYLFADYIDLRVQMTKLHVLLMSIEFAFSMFLIGYIMHLFSIVNSYAEKNKKKAFLALQIEKQVVEKQNKEKTALLQEIHHRVKNNLQVIISLLRIQSSKLKSQESIRSFNDAITRIMTMSLIHKKMYEKESLVDIDIVDYINTLVEDLIITNVTKDEILYKVNADIEHIGSKTVVPLALIINELVSNSLKHAFEDGGNIFLEIKNKNKKYFEMKYSDNGKWKDKSKDTSFGLQLIEVFTDQLEGSFERKIDENGTHYTFQLKSVDQ